MTIVRVVEINSPKMSKNKHSTKRLIEYTCDTCGMTFRRKFQTKYLSDRKTHYHSKECASIGRRVGGSIHASSKRDGNEWYRKLKESVKAKYGVDNVSVLNSIKKKKSLTTMKNFGVDNPLKSSKIIQKVKQTCLKRYGTDNPLKSPTVRKKIKQTCIERFGVENYSQTLEFNSLCTSNKTHRSGKIVTKLGEFYYRSSYELRFLSWCDRNASYIKSILPNLRFKYRINENDHYYFADFLLEFTNGIRIIYEIKPLSFLALEIVEIKAMAARTQLSLYKAQDYIFITEKTLEFLKA